MTAADSVRQRRPFRGRLPSRSVVAALAGTLPRRPSD